MDTHSSSNSVNEEHVQVEQNDGLEISPLSKELCSPKCVTRDRSAGVKRDNLTDFRNEASGDVCCIIFDIRLITADEDRGNETDQMPQEDVKLDCYGGHEQVHDEHVEGNGEGRLMSHQLAWA